MSAVADATPGGSVPVEILLIDNGSNEENRKKTEQLVEEIRTAGTPIRYVYEPAEFNFSTMCNRGGRTGRWQAAAVLK